ncbi:MAG: copper chaperone PCu(A)C [Alphaproteobacteria bacterium]|nr:copper chaperone PCu(A)C [Alphaproteobacteria bacterium]
MLAITCLGAHASSTGVGAAEAKAGNLIIDTPWTRATPGGAKVGAGYMAIINTAGEVDRLTGAASPIAERVEVHSMSMDNGVMRMRRIDEGLEIKPRSVTALKPGGYHLMFIGLKKKIAEGDEIPVELTFEKAGTVDLKLTAAAIGAMKPAGAAATDVSPFGSSSGVGGGTKK